ncbi:MAG: sugar phosphate isomerase/epimerase [Planctomycetaceae bacterium]|nr:sugar phosphate isomerase/epimerase [Planctomycetaceae bacterium]
MKYAMCNELYEAWSFERVCDFLAEHGYGGVEVAPFTFANDARTITPERRERLRRVAEKSGVQITGLHWLLAKTEGFHLTSPDATVRKQTAEYFAALIQLCADFHGSYMVLGSPQQRSLLPGVTREQAMDYACDVLGQLVPMLEKTGIVLAIEPLTPAETDFITTAAEGVGLMKRIDAPQQIALHLDCKAMTSEPEPIPDLIRKYRKEMVTFHANDPNLQGPGFGELDFVPIMAALHDIEFDGWVSVETFDYSPGPERLTIESIEYMKRCGG